MTGPLKSAIGSCWTSPLNIINVKRNKVVAVEDDDHHDDDDVDNNDDDDDDWSQILTWIERSEYSLWYFHRLRS